MMNVLLADAKITPEQKAAWVAALRSGEYPQARGKMHVEGFGYCCLGVLQKIALDPAAGEDYEPVDELLGSAFRATCARLNDHELFSFAQIADKIEDGSIDTAARVAEEVELSFRPTPGLEP